MSRTVVSSHKKEVVIGFDRPFCIIGERINPTGRKKLAAEMAAGDFSTVERDTIAGLDAAESDGEPFGVKQGSHDSPPPILAGVSKASSDAVGAGSFADLGNG